MKKRAARSKRRVRTAAPELPDVPEGYGTDWDDDFECIAGFTSGGAPFGLRWGESDALSEHAAAVDHDADVDHEDDDGIPF